MALETLRKEQQRIENEEKKKLTGEDVEEKAPMTMREIMTSKEDSDLMGKMLDATGEVEDKKLMARVVTGNLVPEDIAVLEKHRKAFQEKKEAVGNVDKELTQDMAVELGRNNSDFQEIINIAGGPGQSMEMIKSHMRELAVTDAGRFAEISKQVTEFQAFKKGEFKDMEDSVKKMCELRKINPDEYMKSLAIGDATESAKALKKQVTSSWCLLAKIADSVGHFAGVSPSDKYVRELMGEKSKIEDVLTKLDSHRKNIGQVLATSVKENPELLKALSKSLLGEPVKKEVVGMKESKSAFLNEAQIDAGWEENKRLMGGQAEWEKMTPDEQDFEVKEFIDRRKQEAKKKSKGGFWAMIFEALFNELLDKKADKFN